MQASQSSVFAAAQGRQQGTRLRNGQYATGSLSEVPTALQPPPQPFFTADYFDSLRPRGAGRDCPPGLARETVGDRRAAGVAAGDTVASGLAHDAGNLLSALSLYSELLAYPEVLGAKHRHYASDLKLLAERSGKLIDRLVALGAEVDGIRQKSALVASSHADAPSHIAEEVPGRAGKGRLISLPSQGSLVLTDDFAASSRMQATKQPSARHGQDDHSKGDHAVFAAAVRESSNLVDVLVACGGVLSTLAGGALEVTMGSQAGLPVGVRQEALERILVNLVKNAALAVRCGGSIRIQVGLAKQTRSSAARRMALTVDDSGCGMSAAKLAELHGAGGASVRVPASGSTESRRGIGLQVVRELVQTSGGSMSIESREGVGTRIEIEWPTLVAAPAVPAQLRSVSPRLRVRPGSDDTRLAGSGIVDRMEMIGVDELTATERRLLMARSNRPVLPAESVAREAINRGRGVQTAIGRTTALPAPDRAIDAARQSETVFAKSEVADTQPENSLREATLDRSFAGSLNRSLDRQRLREQQNRAVENEGAIAC